MPEMMSIEHNFYWAQNIKLLLCIIRTVTGTILKECPYVSVMAAFVLIDTHSRPYICCLCERKKIKHSNMSVWSRESDIQLASSTYFPIFLSCEFKGVALPCNYTQSFPHFGTRSCHAGSLLVHVSTKWVFKYHLSASFPRFPSLLYGIILDTNLLALWRRRSSSNLFLTKWIPAELSQLWCLYHAGEKGTRICSAQSNLCFCSDKM